MAARPTRRRKAPQVGQRTKSRPARPATRLQLSWARSEQQLWAARALAPLLCARARRSSHQKRTLRSPERAKLKTFLAPAEALVRAAVLAAARAHRWSR